MYCLVALVPGVGPGILVVSMSYPGVARVWTVIGDYTLLFGSLLVLTLLNSISIHNQNRVHLVAT